MVVSPTSFRKDLFKLLDQIAATHEVLEIHRNGKIFKVFPPNEGSKLHRLTPHNDVVNGNEGSLDVDWNEEWKPYI